MGVTLLHASRKIFSGMRFCVVGEILTRPNISEKYDMSIFTVEDAGSRLHWNVYT
jgi:hypothetical protein